MEPEKTLLNGQSPDEMPDYREKGADGMQKSYLILSDKERAKGWIRPFRDVYLHRVCHTETKMGRELSETYARDPKFYTGTFCVKCRAHFPLEQFVWAGTNEQVGS